MHKLLALLRNNKKVDRPKAMAGVDEVYIYEPIVADPDTAEWCGGVCPDEFVPALKAMTANPIHVRMNCPGGDVFAGQAMAQAIREHPSKIVCHIDGVAASVATVIACACDEVIMAPGATYMIHKTWTFAMGNSDDMLETASMLDIQDGVLAQQYAEKTGGDAAELLALMAEETWMTAQEAVDKGFADAVFKSEKQAVKALWDLSAYAKAPKAEKPPVPETPEPDQTEHRERQAQRVALLSRTRT